MNVKELFPSKYLRAEDLTQPVNVTIQSVQPEKMHKPGQGEVNGQVLRVVNGSRGIVLSKPLAFSIAEALGEWDTEAWPGRRVQLYPVHLTVAGRAVTGIRARPAPQPVQAGTNGHNTEQEEV